MSQLQGNSYTTSKSSAVANYWPGHVIADSLAYDENDSIFEDESSPVKSRHSSAGGRGGRASSGSSRTNSHLSHGSTSMSEFKNKDHNNNTTPTTSTTNVNIDNSIKKASNSKRITKIKPGDAFSAIINSMLPLDIIEKIQQSEETVTFEYDEFGFRSEKEETNKNDQTSQNSSSEMQFININLGTQINPLVKNLLTSQPFLEESKHKLKWIAYLEFTLNTDLDSSAFSWDQVTSLNRCDKLKVMIRGQGIPHSLRPFIWMRLSGALSKKLNSKFKYSEILKNFQHDQFHTSKQIEKDLLRTVPTNACFYSLTSVGIPRLRRVLQSIAWLYPSIGYCQGMGSIVASLLLFLEEEDAFWLMCSIVEDILPVSYYSHTLLGVQADMKVLRQLIATYLPEVDRQLKEYDIELSLVLINWYLTIFSNVFHIRILLRIWDLFFLEGSTTIFQITLAMLKLNEKALLSAESSSQIFSILSEIPSEIYDIDSLIETSIRVASSVNKSLLDVARKKHQAYLMAQNGSIINPSNYQNLPLSKEKPQRFIKSDEAFHLKNSNFFYFIFKRSIVTNSSKSSLNSGESDDQTELKMKNIHQTEFIVNLREIILKIAHHFQTYDKDVAFDCDLNADYSVESHNRDYDVYMDTSKAKQFKRAKAILDFDKTDDDELGFRQNDIITVLSTKDDHCWIGEASGEKGWFPSKFVTLIDERNGKVYSQAGDDSLNTRIRDLIRGEFSLALKQIFEHGLKRWSMLNGIRRQHPWLFVEEAAKKIVEKDFESVYSRLILCKTYRLDEDGKVLTPDELLFRSIQTINASHDLYKADMDLKFRSLLCLGLNERVLHIWLETLCSHIETVEKWYDTWSFLRSPGWVQIKCELRVLAQFSFLLNADAELPQNKKDVAIYECIKDMLVKHHLFSWDIN